MGLFSDSHLDNIVAIVFGEVDAFLTTKNAIVVSAMEQNAKAIFELYFAVEPPFGDGTKRNEFPDAFVISALVDWCHDRKEDLFVVTQDGLFLKACEEEPRLDAVECLSGLLNRVASDEAALADFLRTQILEHLEEIENRTKEDFESLGFHVEDEWGDAEVSVTKIELEGGPDLVDVTGTMVSAELRFDAEYDAYLSYDDSSTGSYDSEEGRLLYMEHKTETVNGTERLFVTVTASFQGMEELDFQLVDVDLTSPSAGFGIETEKNAGWPWK
ncbi:MAG: hypothetical protein F4053_09760 [Proteobacteria bacterium]|nr:hypothetical protein [Pseudomonadota bacterium]